MLTVQCFCGKFHRCAGYVKFLKPFLHPISPEICLYLFYCHCSSPPIYSATAAYRPETRHLFSAYMYALRSFSFSLLPVLALFLPHPHKNNRTSLHTRKNARLSLHHLVIPSLYRSYNAISDIRIHSSSITLKYPLYMTGSPVISSIRVPPGS